MKIENEDQLRALYQQPKERVWKKQLNQLDEHALNFLSRSPFLSIATTNAEGKMDVSPRGGKPGFVKVLDTFTLLLPDAKGNNRLDTLSNIVHTGRVGTLFFIPGMDETLRVNGKAWLSTAKEHLDPFEDEQHPPRTCIVIEIEEVFLHCAKALMRSQLWSAEAQIERSEWPTMGKMLRDQVGDNTPIETQEEMLKRYQKDL